MKKILIPTDFSDNAADALDYALHLAKGQNVRLYILNVVQSIVVPVQVPVGTSGIMKLHLDDAWAAMEAIEALCKQFYGDNDDSEVRVTTDVHLGNVAQQIKAVAKKEKIDIVIMGTQGKNHGVGDKLVGTISTSILNDAPCPVILVPQGYEFKTIDNLIFATKLNHKAPYELWRAIEVIKPHVARVRCVYVTKESETVNKNELDQFARYMVENSPSEQTIFNVEESNNIDHTLSQYAENYDAEMTIMCRSKKSFWERLFTIRHTQKMATLIHVPLMILNNKW
ncbi:MAG: nucleotide-binding universal stress UspA family protein [Saprospiraceae bacterium]|jgi:nucleotide-binding universal stress UspA family protein|tara:strand:+ start:102 stop:950 length:849 start_codon:yes stop_codon:yes gene_type:complete